MYQLCMGIPYGAPADPLTLAAMVNQLPEGAVWASFALGPMQMPWVAQSVLLGGHVRVGLEDNLYLSKGVKATNAQLVERARTIVEAMGAKVATPDEAREILALKARADDVTRGRHPEDVRTVTCVGAGVIGGGWVAYFLARGYHVRRLGPGRRTPRSGCGTWSTRPGRRSPSSAWPTGPTGPTWSFEPDLATAVRAGRLRAGERAGGPRPEAQAARRHRRRHARRRGHLVVDVRLRHERDAGRAARTRSAPWSGTRSTRRTSSRWSRSSAAS